VLSTPHAARWPANVRLWDKQRSVQVLMLARSVIVGQVWTQRLTNYPSRPIDISLVSTDDLMVRVQDVPPLVEQRFGSFVLWHPRVNLLGFSP
jgi:hypothetical protein